MAEVKFDLPKKSVSYKDTMDLVDLGGKIKSDIDFLENKLNIIKKEIKSLAKKSKVKEVHGRKIKAIVSPMTATNIDPEALFELCMERDIPYTSVSKPQVTDAKNLLGASALEGISETVTKKYAKVAFKSK
jgi:hypothetical protein